MLEIKYLIIVQENGDVSYCSKRFDAKHLQVRMYLVRVLTDLEN